MLHKIVLIEFILLYFVVECVNKQQFNKNVSNDSNESLQNLFRKFKESSNNQKELNEIQKLNQILNDIKIFEKELSEQQNSSSLLKSGFIDRKIFDFIVEVVVNIAKVVDVTNLWYSLKNGISTSLTCLACQSISPIVFNRLISSETLAFAFIHVCTVLDLTDYEVCEGFVSTFKYQIDYIRQNTKLELIEVCGIIMGDQCYIGKSENLHWKLDIPVKLNKQIKTKDNIKPEKKYDILHITDIHLDLEYVPNMDTECKTPYCCRRSLKNSEPNMTTNYWGSYPCDTPLQTLENWVQHMEWSEIDWTYWTGDVVPHDSWRDNWFKSFQAFNVITNYLKKYNNNKLVVPAIGNHIAVPVGSYPPPLIDSDFSISWLYNELAKEWSQWLPSEALDSIRYAGYYALTLKSGFRIIVLNTNYCARLNVWTFYQSIDPADQLKWLIHQLKAAEEAGDLVHILGHLPPDNRECTQSWLYNFMAIVERYSDTIVGQFYGHTHNDEFRVLYSIDNSSKPIGLEIISPSLTTYNEANPAYRIISCDQNGQLIDMNTYTFDLEEANSVYKSLPKWYHEYSMAQTYSIESFDGQEFHKIVENIESNEKYLQTFYTLKHRDSSFAKNICDKECKSKIIYDTVIGNPFLQKPKPIIESVTNSHIKS